MKNKKIILSTLFLILLLGIAFAQQEQKADPKSTSSSDSLVTMTLNVEGMTCGSCEYHVDHAAKGVKGVHSCNADRDKGVAVIQFDPKQTTAEDIAKAITEKGYQTNVPKP